MSKVICVCFGDSSDISVWSNVPYFVTRELHRNGYDVVRCNIMPNGSVAKFCQSLIGRILSLFYPDHEWNLTRTQMFRLWANNKICRVVKKHSDADWCLFFTYSFSCPIKAMPSALLCDWTLETLISSRRNRKPYWFEQKPIKCERQTISSAKYVTSLFPRCAKSIKEQVPEANIITPGKLPINNFEDDIVVSEKLIEHKSRSKNILFIGRQKYKNACGKLIEAINLLNSRGNAVYDLHVVGLTVQDFEDARQFENIHFYGFLHKDIGHERDLYYNLLKQATLFANPTPEWGGYSSTLEAMLYFTPVLVARYEEFAFEFGEDINFGAYTSFSVEEIARSIETIVSHPDYSLIARSAHEAVKDRTWDKYVKKLIKEINL